jgi:RND superfamily putative drug exporter
VSTFLYRLGRAGYAHPIRVLGAWLVLLAVLVTTLALNPPRMSTEMRIDGTPAQEVIDQLARDLPEAAGGQGQLIFQAPDGEQIDSPELGAAVADAVADIYDRDVVIDPAELIAAQQPAATPDRGGPAATLPPGTMVVDGQPVLGATVSPDGKIVILQFQFTKQVVELPTDTVENIIAAAEAPTESAGITVLPGATLQTIPEVIGVGEIVGLAVAAVVLVVTLGSLVAAGLPLATALLGVGTGISGTFALSHLFELNSMSVVLALMLGLAVGIDYALFIVNRQRRLILEHGLDAKEAAARAVGTAGSAVFFAGTTVIIALVALLVVQINLLTSMALIAAGTVAIAVLVALTFLPALLGLVKERICSPKARAGHAKHSAVESRRSLSHRWATFVARHRRPVVAAVVAVAALLAVPIASMNLGLPSGGNYNTDTAQRQGYDAVTESFGEGLNGPLIVVATSTEPGAAVSPTDVQAVVTDLARLDGVQIATAAGMSADGKTALLSVIPTTGPTDEATKDVVTAVRDLSDRYEAELGVDIGVTGLTAMGIDVSERLTDVLPVYLAVVLGLSLIVLLLVFRSILVPIKATVGFLLSILATFGATTVVFQWGWLKDLFGFDATTPVMSMLPIIVTGVLYGLAMDYQVFLVSSMRESHVHGHRGTDSVVHGFTQASRVVVAAAVIMIAVFAGFIFNADPIVKQMGFALAIGIAIDAFLIRLTLVPAMMAMFGDRAWWLPRWLDRLLPNLDVEGDKLLQRLAAEDRGSADAHQTATEAMAPMSRV